MKTKIELREYYKQQRRTITEKEFQDGNEKICASLYCLKQYKEARTIMAYLSTDTEVSVDSFIEKALIDNKKVYVPYCVSYGMMKAVRLMSLNEVEFGRYGIRIPIKYDEMIENDKIDLVVVPGVAFDKKGGRLGMGAGFYDRFIKENSFCIGVGWQVQIAQEELPMDKHDKFMDIIISEHGIINCLR